MWSECQRLIAIKSQLSFRAHESCRENLRFIRSAEKRFLGNLPAKEPASRISARSVQSEVRNIWIWFRKVCVLVVARARNCNYLLHGKKFSTLLCSVTSCDVHSYELIRVGAPFYVCQIYALEAKNKVGNVSGGKDWFTIFNDIFSRGQALCVGFGA